MSSFHYGVPKICTAKEMFAFFNINNFDSKVRHFRTSFRYRLFRSRNNIVNHSCNSALVYNSHQLKQWYISILSWAICCWFFISYHCIVIYFTDVIGLIYMYLYVFTWAQPEINLEMKWNDYCTMMYIIITQMTVTKMIHSVLFCFILLWHHYSGQYLQDSRML